MDKCIIYPNSLGGIAIVTPAECGLTIEQIAAKDVPQGLPYKIVCISEIPTDRTYREAWESDFSEPDGIGGVEYDNG